MKKTGLLNPELNYSVARLGHTDTWAVADCGLPVPQRVRIIDLSLVFGVPTFAQVVRALLAEVVVEGAYIAREAPPQVRRALECPVTEVDHGELKALIGDCAFVVRTGETTAFANAVFRSGVAF
ncbi:D-ribose pyranase [Corynebacterium pacaense]|uniref:D-ribose pyranase n=1 Tax=Corynebacterium pacaense TaxID=1816684 RepID=UPI0009BAE038|nr:D-ribose pyranase [Corynebacterium pacaense]